MDKQHHDPKYHIVRHLGVILRHFLTVSHPPVMPPLLMCLHHLNHLSLLERVTDVGQTSSAVMVLVASSGKREDLCAFCSAHMQDQHLATISNCHGSTKTSYFQSYSPSIKHAIISNCLYTLQIIIA